MLPDGVAEMPKPAVIGSDADAAATGAGERTMVGGGMPEARGEAALNEELSVESAVVGRA